MRTVTDSSERKKIKREFLDLLLATDNLRDHLPSIVPSVISKVITYSSFDVGHYGRGTKRCRKNIFSTYFTKSKVFQIEVFVKFTNKKI